MCERRSTIEYPSYVYVAYLYSRFLPSLARHGDAVHCDPKSAVILIDGADSYPHMRLHAAGP